MSRYHDPGMYAYQAEYIRKNKCHTCYASGTVYVGEDRNDEVRCGHCEGTKKATKKDRERLALHDKGVCLICKLPHVEGREKDPSSKYEPSGNNDCLDHLRQYVLRLEARVAALEDTEGRNRE